MSGWSCQLRYPQQRILFLAKLSAASPEPLLSAQDPRAVVMAALERRVPEIQLIRLHRSPLLTAGPLSPSGSRPPVVPFNPHKRRQSLHPSR